MAGRPAGRGREHGVRQSSSSPLAPGGRVTRQAAQLAAAAALAIPIPIHGNGNDNDLKSELASASAPAPESSHELIDPAITQPPLSGSDGGRHEESVRSSPPPPPPLPSGLVPNSDPALVTRNLPARAKIMTPRSVWSASHDSDAIQPPSASASAGEAAPSLGSPSLGSSLGSSSLASLSLPGPPSSYMDQAIPFHGLPIMAHATPPSTGSTYPSVTFSVDSPKNLSVPSARRLLLRLDPVAVDLFRFLAARDTIDPDDAEFDVYTNVFHKFRSYFVETDDEVGFINPERLFAVLSAGTYPTDSPFWHSVSASVVTANLTTLLQSIMVLPDSTGNRFPFLRSWEVSLPGWLIPVSLNCNDFGLKEIATLVLLLRTHLSIAAVKWQLDSCDMTAPPPFNSHFATIASVFFNGPMAAQELESTLQQSGPDVRLANVREVPGIDFCGDEWLRKMYVARVRELCEAFPRDNDPIDFALLEERFPFADVITGLRTFVKMSFNKTQARLQESRARVQQSGAYPPAAAFPSPSQDYDLSSQTVSDGMQSTAVDSSQDIHPDAAAAQALQMERETGSMASSYRMPSQDIIDRSRSIQLGAYPSPDEYGNNGILYANSAAQSDLQPVVDSLYGAPSASSPLPPPPAGQKRPAADMEDSDNAFEEDRRPARKKRRAPKPRPLQPRSIRSATSSTIDTTAAIAAIAALHSGAVVNTGPGADVNDLDAWGDEASMNADLDTLTQRSREIAAASRAPRPPQTRTMWTQDDVRKLIKMVHVFQCKWSTMQKEIDAGNIKLDNTRDQQALRDKARLMKQDFLKTDAVLPPSFDQVVLGRKERLAITLCGKNPDRREADVVNGVAINTLYRPEGNADAEAPVPPPTPTQEQQLLLEGAVTSPAGIVESVGAAEGQEMAMAGAMQETSGSTPPAAHAAFFDVAALADAAALVAAEVDAEVKVGLAARQAANEAADEAADAGVEPVIALSSAL